MSRGDRRMTLGGEGERKTETENLKVRQSETGKEIETKRKKDRQTNFQTERWTQRQCCVGSCQ